MPLYGQSDSPGTCQELLPHPPTQSPVAPALASTNVPAFGESWRALRRDGLILVSLVQQGVLLHGPKGEAGLSVQSGPGPRSFGPCWAAADTKDRGREALVSKSRLSHFSIFPPLHLAFSPVVLAHTLVRSSTCRSFCLLLTLVILFTGLNLVWTYWSLETYRFQYHFCDLSSIETEEAEIDRRLKPKGGYGFDDKIPSYPTANRPIFL